MKQVWKSAVATMIAGALGFPASTTQAQEVVMDYAVDLVSDYVFRGIDLRWEVYVSRKAEETPFNVAPAVRQAVGFYSAISPAVQGEDGATIQETFFIWGLPFAESVSPNFTYYADSNTAAFYASFGLGGGETSLACSLLMMTITTIRPPDRPRSPHSSQLSYK